MTFTGQYMNVLISIEKKKAKSKELLYRCVRKPVDTKLLEGDTVEPD